MATTSSHDSFRRARRSFWVLTLLAVAAAGSLSAAVAAPAGALTGLWFVCSGLVLVAAVSLAARVSIAIERAGRRASGERAGEGTDAATKAARQARRGGKR